jgi:Na+:H+ antiporter, NhaA family
MADTLGLSLYWFNLPESLAPAVMRPFLRFARKEASGGILLLTCTLVALIWANSPWAVYYEKFAHAHVLVGFGKNILSESLHFWINDGLMAFFFFFVGLEIKREILIGELSTFRKAALPMSAAAGGVIVPALIYTAMNSGAPSAHGWGIPMATDIAFALGVLALLGSRIPASLKLFLAALAIVDDIIAVLVIALFYTDTISWDHLWVAAVCLFLAIVANKIGITSSMIYALIGIGLWLAMLHSGVHATLAGVLLAFTIPGRTQLNPISFYANSHELLERFKADDDPATEYFSKGQQVAFHELEEQCAVAQPPLQRLEHGLHPWVTFMIMPLFALVNAGVDLRGFGLASLLNPITTGIVLGLVIGKPLGIMLASWLSVASKIAEKPASLSWAQIQGAAWLGGIGFTMSLFIGGLAFDSDAMLAIAKVAIILASVIAGCAGSLILIRVSRKNPLSELG